MLPADTGDSGGALGGYELVGTASTFRVNQNNTTTPLIEITARSVKYDVTFTWDVTAYRFRSDGGEALANGKTAEVEVICAHEHVQGFSTEKEENRSGLLYNFAVILVGTADQTITDTVSVRMDQINTPGAFAAIDACWDRLVRAGAPPGG